MCSITFYQILLNSRIMWFQSGTLKAIKPGHTFSIQDKNQKHPSPDPSSSQQHELVWWRLLVTYRVKRNASRHTTPRSRTGSCKSQLKVQLRQLPKSKGTIQFKMPSKYERNEKTYHHYTGFRDNWIMLPSVDYVEVGIGVVQVKVVLLEVPYTCFDETSAGWPWAIEI